MRGGARGARGGGRRSFEGNKRNDRGFNKNASKQKPDLKTVSKEPINNSHVTPKKEDMPSSTNNSVSSNEKQRSRSPIDKKDLSTTALANPATKPTTTNVARYSGRPGEKKFSGRCRLFVANLNTNMTEDDVTNIFQPYGETSEVYFNKDKGFGFIRLDFRINAETAKSELDKKIIKGRTIQVRFATHASAIELHGLDQYASNELIEKAMSQFGVVERAVIVCDDRGRSKGYAIVEFEWKKTAQKVLDRFKGEMFVLGRLPKPVFAKPLTQHDDEDGVTESSLERVPGIQQEREFNPRFISPSSFEYQWSQKWRDLYMEEQDKKAKLEHELEDARYKVELEMETALREQDAIRIREELSRRQEELRKIEEDMHQRRQMALGNRQPPPGMRGMDNRGRNQFDNQGPPSRGPPGRGPDMNQDFRPQNNMMQQGPNNNGMMRQPMPDHMNMQRHQGPQMMGNRPGMMQQNHGGPGILQPNMGPGMLPGPGGPRGPPPRMHGMNCF